MMGRQLQRLLGYQASLAHSNSTSNRCQVNQCPTPPRQLKRGPRNRPNSRRRSSQCRNRPSWCLPRWQAMLTS